MVRFPPKKSHDTFCPPISRFPTMTQGSPEHIRVHSLSEQHLPRWQRFRKEMSAGHAGGRPEAKTSGRPSNLAISFLGLSAQSPKKVSRRVPGASPLRGPKKSERSRKRS